MCVDEGGRGKAREGKVVMVVGGRSWRSGKGEGEKGGKGRGLDIGLKSFEYLPLNSVSF